MRPTPKENTTQHPVRALLALLALVPLALCSCDPGAAFVGQWSGTEGYRTRTLTFQTGGGFSYSIRTDASDLPGGCVVTTSVTGGTYALRSSTSGGMMVLVLTDGPSCRRSGTCMGGGTVEPSCSGPGVIRESLAGEWIYTFSGPNMVTIGVGTGDRMDLMRTGG